MCTVWCRDVNCGWVESAWNMNWACWVDSDADVLIHAICDALLGAANLRDIGYHFPDNSAEFKNIDSKILLAKPWN